MDKYLFILIEGLIVFILIFLFNYLFFVRKKKKYKKDDMPLELTYISAIYRIDPKRINFRKFQYIYSLLNSFIVTTTYLIVIYLVKSMLFKVILGIVILILLIIICYGLLGRYYIHLEEKMLDKKK